MTYWITGATAVGALVDRKNPLRGAALGAGTMFTGGALAGGLGAGAAAGGAAAGTGLAASGTGLAATGTTAGTGLAGTATQGLMAGNLALPGAGTGGFNAAGAAIDAGMSPGFVGGAQSLGNMFGNGVGTVINAGDKLSSVAKPVMQGVQAAQSAMPQEAPMQMPSAPSIRSGPPDFGAVLQVGQQQREHATQIADLRRKQQQAMVNRMFG